MCGGYGGDGGIESDETHGAGDGELVDGLGVGLLEDGDPVLVDGGVSLGPACGLDAAAGGKGAR